MLSHFCPAPPHEGHISPPAVHHTISPFFLSSQSFTSCCFLSSFRLRLLYPALTFVSCVTLHQLFPYLTSPPSCPAMNMAMMRQLHGDVSIIMIWSNENGCLDLMFLSTVSSNKAPTYTHIPVAWESILEKSKHPFYRVPQFLGSSCVGVFKHHTIWGEHSCCLFWSCFNFNPRQVSHSLWTSFIFSILALNLNGSCSPSL